MKRWLLALSFVISLALLIGPAGVSAAQLSPQSMFAQSLETLAGPDKSCEARPLNKDNCGIVAVIVIFTNVLAGLVGIIIVTVIIIGGIQYSIARSDPSAVAAARRRIFNAVIALLLYIFTFAILQYLVPGGLF